MKILFINGTNSIGGGELSLLSIVKNLKHDTCVVSFADGEFTKLLNSEKIKNIVLKNSNDLLNVKREHGIFSLVFKSKSLLLTILEIRKLSKNYDILYFNSQKAILLGLFSTLYLKRKKVIHVRDMMNNPNISKIQKYIFRLIVNFQKPIVVSNSNSSKNALIEIGIKLPIDVIYNGIQAPIIKGKNSDKFVVGMFSRISHWKGHHIFVEAIKNLQKETENIEFWIVGDAVMGSEEEKYKQKILDLINEYKLANKIKLLGFVTNPIDYMQNIDVLVLPSIYPEPFGRVVIEAMFLKKVVIATNFGGPIEIIDNNRSGILIEPSNSNELSRAISTLYNNKFLYNELSKEGYKKVINTFTEQKMIKDIMRILN